jgi:hypothetical protein
MGLEKMSDILTQPVLTVIFERFGQEAAHITQREIHAAWPGNWFKPEHGLALGCRETALANIRGGAVLVNGVWVPSDTDEGVYQITNTVSSNATWLRSVPGCPNGSFKPDMPGFHSGKVNALTPAHNPTLSAGLTYTIAEIQANRAQAGPAGVKPNDVLRFVIAAHNAGFQGALEGYESGDVDRFTTHGNYSQWCLDNVPAITKWLDTHPKWRWTP